MYYVNILGYFKEKREDGGKSKEELLYFVAYENEKNYSSYDTERKWVEGFNVIDGHFQLKDKGYLEECERITKEQYVEATKNYKTPEIYLKG